MTIKELITWKDQKEADSFKRLFKAMEYVNTLKSGIGPLQFDGYMWKELMGHQQVEASYSSMNSQITEESLTWA